MTGELDRRLDGGADDAAPATAPVADAGTAPVADAGASPPAAPSGADGSLLAILDRLTSLLERSDLTELEVEAGGTGLVLRKASAVAAALVAAPAAATAGGATDHAPPGGVEAGLGRPSVKAPLTGIFYAAPSPGAAPYVHVGGEVAVGQVIGLIEAMKLFNEIKSDLAGRVVRVVAESGQLVKARQPLIEVEPL
jgi:acetyl-CoA carboxylase biotin carboxyl carrier protein